MRPLAQLRANLRRTRMAKDSDFMMKGTTNKENQLPIAWRKARMRALRSGY
jgi:hypothetical protein